MEEKIAKKLARELVRIYNEHKIPRYTALNRSYSEGFTREKMQGNPNSLFQMIILAAYDRRPFTMAARGWEAIWGVADTRPSLPAILRSAGVFDLDSALSITREEIEQRLSVCLFFGYRLHFDGAYTRFSKTFKDAGSLVDGGFLNLIESAKTSQEVKAIHAQFDSVHGIGPTIASKLVMYTLREIRLSDIDPRELYPAVKPILTEYHNSELAKKLKNFYGPDIVEQVFNALGDLGDPYAIDALYYIDRDEPELIKSLMFNEAIQQSYSDSEPKEEIENEQAFNRRSALSIPDKVVQVATTNFSGQPFSRKQLHQTIEAAYGRIKLDSFLTADWTVNQKSGYKLDIKSGRWYKRHQILFKREDGLFEPYNPMRHGTWTLINGRPQRIA